MIARYADVRYADVPGFGQLLLDLVVPASEQPVPVVVFLHGGGFTSGTHKAEHYPLARQANDALTRQGIAVASIQYRLSGEARFPVPLHDVKAAVRWLREHADEYGLDSCRIGAFGDSAGGYFAAMLATTAEVDELNGLGTSPISSSISVAVSWFGPTHLLSQPTLGPPHLGDDPASSPEARFLGAPVSSVPDLAELASPLTHVSVRSAPILLVHGTMDSQVPPEQSELLHRAYLAAGASSQVMRVTGGNHGFDGIDTGALMRISTDYLAAHLVIHARMSLELDG